MQKHQQFGADLWTMVINICDQYLSSDQNYYETIRLINIYFCGDTNTGHCTVKN